jgi:heat shock protein HslJ
MKHHRTLRMILLLVLLMVLPVLAAPAPEGAAALMGATWRLERILDSDGKELRPIPGQTYSVQFLANGRLTGQSALNRIMGSYTVGGMALTIGPLVSTRVAEPPGSISAEFLKSLGLATLFRVEGDQLTVTLKGDAGTMSFAREGARDPSSPGSDAAAVAPLVGEWTLIRMNGRALPAGGELPTIVFDARGAVSGTTGVNRYTTSADMAQLAEGHVALRPIATTKRAGPPDAMQRETEFLDALQKVRVWKLSGRTLFLEDGGQELLVFRRRS